MAVNDEHPLRAFSLLGQPDVVAPLFGGRKRAIEEAHGPIDLALLVERREGCSPHALPNALFSPPFQPSPDRCRRAILAWQVLPAAVGDEDVEDTLNRPTIVGAGTT